MHSHFHPQRASLFLLFLNYVKSSDARRNTKVCFIVLLENHATTLLFKEAVEECAGKRARKKNIVEVSGS